VQLLQKDNLRISELESELHFLRGQVQPDNISSMPSCNSHMIQGTILQPKHSQIPNLNLSKVSPDLSECESHGDGQDIDMLIEGAIETELENNPDIANEFDNLDEFKKYIFEK